MESHSQSETTTRAARIVLECPECLNLCSPADEECSRCGLRFRPKSVAESGPNRTIHFDPVTKKRFTDTVTIQIGNLQSSRHRRLWMLTNLVLGLVTAAIGGLMAYYMPFGFECGFILVFVGALFMLNVYLTSDGKDKRIDGSCPNCGEMCSMLIGKRKNSGTGRCEKCNKLFRYDGIRFEEA